MYVVMVCCMDEMYWVIGWQCCCQYGYYWCNVYVVVDEYQWFVIGCECEVVGWWEQFYY